MLAPIPAEAAAARGTLVIYTDYESAIKAITALPFPGDPARQLQRCARIPIIARHHDLARQHLNEQQRRPQPPVQQLPPNAHATIHPTAHDLPTWYVE